MAIRIFKRSTIRAANNLGIIELDPGADAMMFRDAALERLDAYYENRQYDKLLAWDQETDATGANVPPRQRKPRIRIAYAKTLSQRLAAKLVGASVFPNFKVEDQPDDQAFFKAIIRESKLKSQILEPVRRMINTGSCLIRFYLSGGALKLEWYSAKYCYPLFQPNGELQQVTIRYVFDDKTDLDKNKQPKKKWFKMDLMMDREVLYDNPDFTAGQQEPQFQVVEEVPHGFGFVQAEWLRTCIIPNEIDGYGITSDLTDFIDELNYSLSQSSTSISYNQDPQLTLTGVNSEEMQDLVRSSSKSWSLGVKGEAKFLESSLNGVQRAIELRDKIRLNIQDISRIVMLDPEKIVGKAQSAKALEILNEPLMDLVDELRLPIEDSLKNLVIKMGIAVLMSADRGMDVPMLIPPGYRPKSMDLDADWPPIFQNTIEDLQKKVALTVQAHTGRVISQETAVKYLAKDFGVEDIQEELKELAAEPPPNPFGGGF